MYVVHGGKDTDFLAVIIQRENDDNIFCDANLVEVFRNSFVSLSFLGLKSLVLP
jgi:hypothetical protein